MAAEVASETVADGLHEPQAITIQRGTNHPLVAVSDGRVIRIAGDGATDLVTGLPTGKSEQNAVSLTMVAPAVLAIGTSGVTQTRGTLLIVELPEPGRPAVEADSAIRFDLPNGHRASAIAASADAVIVTAVNAKNEVVIFRLPIRKADLLDDADGYGRFEGPFSTDLHVAPAHTTVAAFTATGELIVGGTSLERSSRIIFYRMTDRQPLVDFPITLNQLTGVAFSPDSNGASNLYVTGTSDRDEAGFFRLEARLRAGRQVTETVRIAALQNPTSLAFDSKGALYVTELGRPDTPTGRVLKFASIP